MDAAAFSPGAVGPPLWVLLVALALPPGLLLCLVRRARLPRWQYVVAGGAVVTVILSRWPASTAFAVSIVVLAAVTVVGVVLALVHQPYQGRRRVGRRDT